MILQNEPNEPERPGTFCDLALGFLIFNVALVTFGLWCWAIPVRSTL